MAANTARVATTPASSAPPTRARRRKRRAPAVPGDRHRVADEPVAVLHRCVGGKRADAGRLQGSGQPRVVVDHLRRRLQAAVLAGDELRRVDRQTALPGEVDVAVDLGLHRPPAHEPGPA